MGRNLVSQPNHPLHVVEEVGEADLGSRAGEANLGSRAGEANGADEQTHWPFLAGEDVLDRRAQWADLRALARAVRRGIGLPSGFLRWICERRRRPARNFSLAFEVIGGVGPDIAGGVVGVHQLGQQRPVMARRIGDPPAADQAMPAIDADVIL